MKITPEELETWTRDFYNALVAPKTLSFSDCYNSTIERQPNEEFRQILKAVGDVTSLGLPFSAALALFPDFFDRNYVTIIRYGEIYGELHLVLERFLDHPEDRFPRCKIPAPDAPSSP